MCLISWILTTFAALAGAFQLSFAAAPPPKTPPDPLLACLLDDDAGARTRLLRALREQGAAPCSALGSYSRNDNGRVRANAVTAMDEAGCADFSAYGGYLLDGSAEVVAALVRTAERRVIREAVPYLLGTLSDRRRIVTGDGAYSLGEAAHRALMVITCQSFHYDPAAPRDDQRNAVTRWRQWYLTKRDLPRGEWEEEGIGRARDYALRDHAPYRIEGLRLLALIGPRALPTLRELLARRPGDLEVEVVCLPDEPPRVTDAVPCALVVRNASSHPVVIAPAPDGLDVRVSLSDAPPPVPGPVRGDPRAGENSKSAAAPGDDAAATLSALAERLTALERGEVRRFEFSAGPVPSAGRYRVRASLADLSAALAPETIPLDGAAGKRGADRPPRADGSPSAIAAETVVRFEQ